MRVRLRSVVVEFARGDITSEASDVIVNAANSELIGGGGVDGAIRKAGGQPLSVAIEKVREETGGCPTGSAVITRGGRLKSKWVVHAVGPRWQGGAEGEADLLASAYRESFKLAERVKAESISLPSLSTGAFGYPVPDAAVVAVRTVMDYLRPESSIKLVRFVLYDETTFNVFMRTMASLLPTRRY